MRRHFQLLQAAKGSGETGCVGQAYLGVGLAAALAALGLKSQRSDWAQAATSRVLGLQSGRREAARGVPGAQGVPAEGLAQWAPKLHC